MFVWGKLIAIALLFVGTNAHAAEREYLRFSADPTRLAFRLPIPTQAECEHSVQQMLFPTESIQAGLEQLAALNRGEQSAAAASCLQEAYREWDTTDFERLAPEAGGTAATDGDGAPLPPKRYRQLAKLHDCLENKEHPGAVPAGCLALTPLATWQKLEDDWMRESEAFESAKKKWMERSLQIGNILQYFSPAATAEPAEAQYLATKAICYRNPDPGKFAQERKAKPVCEGLWQDEPLTAGERSRWTQLLNQQNDAQIEKSIRLAPLRVFLSQPGSEALLAESGLPELAQQLQCANESEPGTVRYAQFRKDRVFACEGHWPNAEQIKELHEKFTARAAPLVAAAKKWNDERLASLDQRQRAFDQNHAQEYKNYAEKRLMALFTAHLAAGGKLSETDAFCARYVQRMKTDRNFFRSAPATFRQYGSLVYAMPEAWDYAAKYGLTEADLAAAKAYTGAYYGQINSALLGGSPLSPELNAFKQAFDGALQRIPGYHDGPVLRFATLPPDILQKHQVGETVCYPSYTSTSRDPNWHWHGAHKMLIYPGKRAHLLETVSFLKNEKEVLFDAGTCFKVLGRQKGQEQEVDLVMAEVDETGKVIAKLPQKLELQRP